MGNNLVVAKDLLENNEDISLVLTNNKNEVYSFENKDIDLLVEFMELIKSEENKWLGSCVAIRKLDRGTAFLLAKLQISEIFAYEVSKLSLEVVGMNDINIDFVTKKEYISNDKNDMFLGEQWVLHIHEKEIEHAFWNLNQKIKELGYDI